MTIKKNISIAFLAVTFVVAGLFAFMPAAKAEAATIDDLLKQIQALTVQLNQLRAQMAGVADDHNDLRQELRAEIREGLTNEDIRKIQEVLASDTSIYPQGLMTGYFGPMTKEALKRFQARFGLTVTGVVDEETREYFEELLGERANGRLPFGLLRMAGIQEKVELRLKKFCDDDGRNKPFCARLDIKYGDDDSNDDSNDDANDDNDDGELEIEVEFEDGDAKVKITYENGKKVNLTIKDTTDEDDIIDAIVDKTDLTKNEVEDAVEFEDSDEGDVEEITARIDTDEDETEVTVEYENGDTDTFTYNTTVKAEIIDLVADEIDMDEDEVDDMIEFEDGSDEVAYIRVAFDGNDSDVTIKYEDGVIDTFTLDNTTLHNDVIEGIGDETDTDEDEIRDMIEFLDGELVIEADVDEGDNETEVDVTYENGDHVSFKLDTTDEDEIIEEIVDRTDLTEEEVEEAIDFN